MTVDNRGTSYNVQLLGFESRFGLGDEIAIRELSRTFINDEGLALHPKSSARILALLTADVGHE